MNSHEQFIYNYPLEQTPFYNFCLTASRDEFLKSQIGFYYAVQAFPQMLCKLASQIEVSEIRIKVAENIWEEHGNGNVNYFHTQSFLNYLNVLGLQKKEVEHNFFVDNWVKETINLNLSASQYATYLAGIEYIYAKISLLICKTLDNFELNGEQEHYKKHSELDFHHAKDLLDVAYSLEEVEHFDIFCQSVNTFVNLFNQMTFINKKQLQKISEEKVAFYYSREDSQIELSCLKINNPSVLTICSGGEHIIHIKNKYPLAKVTALDINFHQLQLAENKIKNILIHQQNPSFNIGKFEMMFEYFANKITIEDIKKIQKNDYLTIKKLELLCRDIFSNHNLNIVFSEEATKYSSDDFSLHFFTVFLSKIREIDNNFSNMKNILGMTLPNSLPLSINSDNITYYHGDFNSLFINNKNKFDLISVSNIGDWMPLEKYIQLIDDIIPFLNTGGSLVARKLLGDYSLKEILSNKFKNTYSYNDNTGFYKESIVGTL